ncbi:MAG: HAD hydrolase-like protein [Pontimonas sp.]|nr:HAD hydrolase-like protein [Pontimonas sp.]
MPKLAVFDIAGTIVSDDGVVISSFIAAFSEVVPEVWAENDGDFLEYAHKTMGQSKIEVFRSLLGDDSLANAAAEAFQAHYLTKLPEVHLFDGVLEMFDSLRSAGVLVALNTGFNRETLDTMLTTLNLGNYVDATATQAEAGEGRPSPAMISHVAQELAVASPQDVAVLGDTRSDMEAAARYGAGLSIGVLTGEHDEVALRDAGAHHVFPIVTDALSVLATR